MDFLLEKFFLPDGGWCPNSHLPLLVYRRVSGRDGEKLACEFEQTFGDHGWPPAWRYTIFDYPHYHSTAPEVIGVYRGRANVRFGDAVGIEMELQSGDIVVIPAGVSHQRVSSSNGFHGVGAYPAGLEVDEIRPDNSKRPEADKRIAGIPLPDRDPWCGGDGPLAKLWHAR